MQVNSDSSVGKTIPFGTHGLSIYMEYVFHKPACCFAANYPGLYVSAVLEVLQKKNILELNYTCLFQEIFLFIKIS